MSTMGWECPRCHQCHAPWVKVCKCIPGIKRQHRWVANSKFGLSHTCSECGITSGIGGSLLGECFPSPTVCGCDGCRNERSKAGKIEYRDTP